MKNFTFSKNEKLKHSKAIDALFNDSSSVSSYPIRIVWKSKTSLEPQLPKVAFSVSKKRFPKACSRNKVKRLLRETYRIHKHIIADRLFKQQKNLNAIFIYTSKEILPFHQLESKMKKVLSKCIEKEIKI